MVTLLDNWNSNIVEKHANIFVSRPFRISYNKDIVVGLEYWNIMIYN